MFKILYCAEAGAGAGFSVGASGGVGGGGNGMIMYKIFSCLSTSRD